VTGKRKSTVPPKRVHVRAFHRLHELVEIIQRGAYPTCADLAGKLERDKRTIRRDIRSLRDDFNAPLEHDRERKGYFFRDRSWRLPRVTMTESDLLTFFHAERKLRVMGRTVETDIARNALGKMIGLLPSEVVIDAAKLYRAIRHAPAPALDADPEVLTALAEAAATRRTLSVDYYSLYRAAHTVREVDVLILHEHLGEWYAVCWDHNSGEVRDFHAGRFLRIEETNRSFAPPDGWDADEYLRRGFGMFRGGESVTVVIVFDAFQARYARERRYHETQRTEELPDGGFRLEFDTTENALEQVARWVLGFGRHARAEGPERLRQMVCEHLRVAFTLYGDARDSLAAEDEAVSEPIET
jgi:predicted DNA-binding transcriptional regulator YafY